MVSTPIPLVFPSARPVQRATTVTIWLIKIPSSALQTQSATSEGSDSQSAQLACTLGMRANPMKCAQNARKLITAELA